MKYTNSNICILEGVCKSFGEDIHILNGINLKLKKGTITALLGPNGSGKTTTIRIILGLLKPDKGKVIVLGNDLSNKSINIRGKVGLLPQINSGYTSLTGLQNINFMLELTGKNPEKLKSKLDRLLVRLDLTNIIEKQWSVLSGGEKRALGFIRAILCGDDLLLLDEPTTGLDLARAAIIRKIIQEEVEKGKTVLMSSHVLTDLEELAGQIAIIKNGIIIQAGSREKILKYYDAGDDLEKAIVTAFLNKSPEE